MEALIIAIVVASMLCLLIRHVNKSRKPKETACDANSLADQKSANLNGADRDISMDVQKNMPPIPNYLPESYVNRRISALKRDMENLRDPARLLSLRLGDLNYSLARLAEILPDHPLLIEAGRFRAMAESETLEMNPPSIQPLTEIGSTEKACPECSSDIGDVPSKGKVCPGCGSKVFARKRPIDERKVLIVEEQLHALEHEWMRDYELKRLNRIHASDS